MNDMKEIDGLVRLLKAENSYHKNSVRLGVLYEYEGTGFEDIGRIEQLEDKNVALKEEIRNLKLEFNFK